MRIAQLNVLHVNYIDTNSQTRCLDLVAIPAEHSEIRVGDELKVVEHALKLVEQCQSVLLNNAEVKRQLDTINADRLQVISNAESFLLKCLREVVPAKALDYTQPLMVNFDRVSDSSVRQQCEIIFERMESYRTESLSVLDERQYYLIENIIAGSVCGGKHDSEVIKHIALNILTQDVNVDIKKLLKGFSKVKPVLISQFSSVRKHRQPVRNECNFEFCWVPSALSVLG